MPKKKLPPLRHPEGRSYRVLVVDDYEAAANSLSWGLKTCGYDVMTGFNAYQAVELSQAFHPDIIILDLSMPKLDGVDTCRILRRLPHLASATIIAQTTWCDFRTVEQLTIAGFTDHMVKPVGVSSLDRLLRDRLTAPPTSFR